MAAMRRRVKKLVRIKAKEIPYPRERLYQAKCLDAHLNLTRDESATETPLDLTTRGQLMEYVTIDLLNNLSLNDDELMINEEILFSTIETALYIQIYLHGFIDDETNRPVILEIETPETPITDDPIGFRKHIQTSGK
jgi:hypothetical protein